MTDCFSGLRGDAATASTTTSKQSRGSYCAVGGCHNCQRMPANEGEAKMSFHRFPSRNLHPGVADEWIAAVAASRDEPGWQPGSGSLVCGAHFVTGAPKKEKMYVLLWVRLFRIAFH